MAASALGRSLDIYYRDAARTGRMDRLNTAFVPSGGLAFDIGAHLGDRTGSFRRCGARVVALEPHPRVFRALRLLQGGTSGVSLVNAAVGDTEGVSHLIVNTRNPTVSTLASDFVDAAAGAEGWEGQVWDGRIPVPVITLDALISLHGVPDFMKLDVEGHELSALSGLSHPVPALSFEITTIQRDVACACVLRLMDLGRYRFNLSLGETHALIYPHWLSAAQICAEIADLPSHANSGDVYARLDP